MKISSKINNLTIYKAIRQFQAYINKAIKYIDYIYYYYNYFTNFIILKHIFDNDLIIIAIFDTNILYYYNFNCFSHFDAIFNFCNNY